MNECPNCHSENGDEIVFCFHCGKKLPTSLRSFLESCDLAGHLRALQARGIGNITTLAEASEDELRPLMPYGDIIRLRKALRLVSGAPAPGNSQEPLLPQDVPVEELPEAGDGDHPASSATPVQSATNATAANAKSALDKARTNYTIMLWSLPSLGLGGVLGAVLAAVFKKKVPVDELAFSHFRFQTRTFGFSLFWGFVLSICEAFVVQSEKHYAVLNVLAWLWFYYRVLKGRALLKEGRPAYAGKIPNRTAAVAVAGLVAIVFSAIIGFSRREKQPAGADESSFAENTGGHRASEAEREKHEAEERAKAAREEADNLREIAKRAELEKEAALQRARELEIALQTAPKQGASYGSSILEFSEAKRRADSGDAYAQAVVSIYYGTGYKTDKDPETAANYAMKSAEQGHPLGIYRLGVMRQGGDGMAPDEYQGLQLKAKALPGLDTMVGDPYAMTALGIMLFRGENIAMDKSNAARLYKKAADMGYAPAQFTYSACLLSGQGVPKNEALGLQYWQAAYQQAYPPALEGPPR